MTQYNAYRIIREVTEALEGSVPRQHYVEALNALNRCREMIGGLAAVIVAIDKEQKHGELMLEAKLYANILNGYFEQEGARFGFRDISNGFDPREYLADKGVIKSANPTRIAMEEQFAAERKRKREEFDALIAEIDGKPKRRRGRPIGSKNKPKAPKVPVGPLYPNSLKRPSKIKGGKK